MINVILLEKISKLGNIGQEVKVKDGFARNYLIPNKKAIRASKENRNFFEQKREELVRLNDESFKLCLGCFLRSIQQQLFDNINCGFAFLLKLRLVSVPGFILRVFLVLHRLKLQQL